MLNEVKYTEWSIRMEAKLIQETLQGVDHVCIFATSLALCRKFLMAKMGTEQSMKWWVMLGCYDVLHHSTRAQSSEGFRSWLQLVH